MALLFMDSFDHYATADFLAKWNSFVSAGLSITATGGRRGGGAAQGTSFGIGVVSPVLPVSGSTLVIGCAYKPGTFANTQAVVRVRTGTTDQFSFTFNTNGFFQAYRGN